MPSIAFLIQGPKLLKNGFKSMVDLQEPSLFLKGSRTPPDPLRELSLAWMGLSLTGLELRLFLVLLFFLTLLLILLLWLYLSLAWLLRFLLPCPEQTYQNQDRPDGLVCRYHAIQDPSFWRESCAISSPPVVPVSLRSAVLQAAHEKAGHLQGGNGAPPEDDGAMDWDGKGRKSVLSSLFAMSRSDDASKPWHNDEPIVATRPLQLVAEDILSGFSSSPEGFNCIWSTNTKGSIGLS